MDVSGFCGFLFYRPGSLVKEKAKKLTNKQIKVTIKGIDSSSSLTGKLKENILIYQCLNEAVGSWCGNLQRLFQLRGIQDGLAIQDIECSAGGGCPFAQIHGSLLGLGAQL